MGVQKYHNLKNYLNYTEGNCLFIKNLFMNNILAEGVATTMQHNQLISIEMLNYIRAIYALNKENLEDLATRLELESSIQLNILWIVYCNEGVRISTIAEWTFWHTSSIVIHVKKLMQKGYVTIEKSELDGRVVNVYLTNKGREVIQKYYELFSKHFEFTKALEAMSKRYSPTVVELFRELLEFVAVELQGAEKTEWLKENINKVIELENPVLRSIAGS